MLGHHHISCDHEIVAATYPREGRLEQFARRCGAQIGLAAITTEGDEMQIAGLLIADESPGHCTKEYTAQRGSVGSHV